MKKRLGVLLTGVLFSSLVLTEVSSAATATTKTPSCFPRDFAVSVGSAGAAAGTQYVTLIFKKHLTGTCTLSGIPATQPVVGKDKVKVGPASNKDKASDQGGVVTLAGTSNIASVQFAIANATNYPKPMCLPKYVDGVVLIFPKWKGTNAHQYFPLRKFQVCTKRASTTISAVVTGSNGE